jgi:hypothetical protein
MSYVVVTFRTDSEPEYAYGPFDSSKHAHDFANTLPNETRPRVVITKSPLRAHDDLFIGQGEA